MLVKKKYYERTNGGLIEWRITDWLLFGFILVYRDRFQLYSTAKGG